MARGFIPEFVIQTLSLFKVFVNVRSKIMKTRSTLVCWYHRMCLYEIILFVKCWFCESLGHQKIFTVSSFTFLVVSPFHHDFYWIHCVVNPPTSPFTRQDRITAVALLNCKRPNRVSSLGIAGLFIIKDNSWDFFYMDKFFFSFLFTSWPLKGYHINFAVTSQSFYHLTCCLWPGYWTDFY